MQTSELNAQSLFNQLISSAHQVTDLTKDPFHEGIDYLKRTQFKDSDTVLYSKLIEKAIAMCRETKVIIDLGAGSSIPTLLALKNSQRKDIQIKAIDIDPEAETVGKENAQFFELSDQFEFIHTRMEDALENLGPFGPETLLVSNPPYIATPSHLNDDSFIPVNGGFYGDKFIQQILNHPFPKGTNLALLWGSLTSPKEIIPLMKKKFEVLHTEVYRTYFGDYTRTDMMKAHLYDLREQGDVFFENNTEGDEVQYIIGNILRTI